MFFAGIQLGVTHGPRGSWPCEAGRGAYTSTGYHASWIRSVTGSKLLNEEDASDSIYPVYPDAAPAKPSVLASTDDCLDEQQSIILAESIGYLERALSLTQSALHSIEEVDSLFAVVESIALKMGYLLSDLEAQELVECASCSEIQASLSAAMDRIVAEVTAQLPRWETTPELQSINLLINSIRSLSGCIC